MEQIALLVKEENNWSQEDVPAGLANVLYHEHPAPRSKEKRLALEERAEAITQIVAAGSSRDMRKGPMPPEKNKQLVKEKILECIQRSEPISAVVSWGCLKTLALGQEGTDLAELLSLEQLILIDRKVREYYSPGIEYSVFLCDGWHLHIYNDGQDECIEVYCSGMELLTRSLSLENIKVIRATDLITADNEERIADRLRQNFELLKRYWLESESVSEEKWGDLPSHKVLEEVGFVGTVPSEMREFYLRKTRRYMPEALDEEVRDYVLKYLAYPLMVKQEDLFGRAKCAVEFSFVSPAPGAPSPHAIYENRLLINSMPRGTTSKAPPPWVVKGVFMLKKAEMRPSVMMVQDVLGDKYRLIQEAVVKISDHGFHLCLSADVYQSK